jgi:hypothetical protein
MGNSDHHNTHESHSHQHGEGCGHAKVKHGDHVDYIHDGHLHSPHEGHVDECKIEVSAQNPEACTPNHTCEGHDKNHVHGKDCGHEAVPHGEHVDYVVSGHLHHAHSGHCDDHGPLTLN